MTSHGACADRSGRTHWKADSLLRPRRLAIGLGIAVCALLAVTAILGPATWWERTGPPRPVATREGNVGIVVDGPTPSNTPPVTNGSGWVNVTGAAPRGAPPPGPAVSVFDPDASADLVLPSGNSSGCSYLYFGTKWTNYGASCPAVGLPLAWDAAPSLAWDYPGRMAVEFGGEDTRNSTAVGTTFLFANDGVWESGPLPSQGPPARWGASMAWDPSDGYVLLFGGTNGTAVDNDTWAFNGTAWTELQPPTAPPARSGAVLVDDPALNADVLFGGNGTGGTLLNDTWTFQDGRWRQTLTPTAPPARAGAFAGYDPSLDSVVVFGGSDSNATLDPHMWFFENGTWTGPYPPTYPTPTGRELGGMATSPSGDGLCLFGGVEGRLAFNDTWLFYTLAPQASAVPTHGEGPLTVNFSASSSNGEAPLTYQWSFGDGQTAYVQNDVHDYPQPGRYAARLVVTDAYGVQGVYNFTIVEVMPFAFSADLTPTTGVAPLRVVGVVNATQGAAPYTITWRFGNGPTLSGASASAEFAAAGAYPVEVWANDSFGRSFERSFAVEVTSAAPPPTLNVSVLANRTAVVAPALVGLDAAAGGMSPVIGFAWDFGDGTSAQGENVTHAFGGSGRFLVTVTALAADGATGTATTTVTVAPALTVAVSGSTTGHGAVDTVRWQALAAGGYPPYRYFWQLNDSAGPVQGANASASYAPGQTVEVQVEVVDAEGNAATHSASVVLIGAPISVPPSSSSLGSWWETAGILLACGTAGLVGGIALTIAVSRGRPGRRARRGRNGPVSPGRRSGARPRPGRARPPTAPRSRPGRSPDVRRPPPGSG